MTASRLGRHGPMIDARALFGPERAALLRLLSSLSEPDWHRVTVCPGWSVFDVAAHILGDDLGRLARSRDQHVGPQPHAGENLPVFLNRFNEQWVVAARRISPQVLLLQLRWSGTQIEDFWNGQDVDRLGEPVSWAGPGPAPVWLDAARDFTEYWTHRQQIADAVGPPVDDAGDVVHTVLDTFVRGLPHALRNHRPPDGTCVAVEVGGRGGGHWAVRLIDGAWGWTESRPTVPSTCVRLDVDTAWRLWTRGIEPEDAQRSVTIEGDAGLADAVLQMVSIIR